jgi:2-octaprenyl-6-methoxyphenol hydroxylase
MAQAFSPTQKLDIVIAGGGVAGLALALALKHARRKSLSIGLYDPAFGRPAGTDTRAYAISAGARRMLDNLGIWEKIAPTAQPLLAMDITDSALEEPIRPLFLSFEGEVSEGEPFAHMVENGPLIQALKQAVEKAGVTLSSQSVSDFKADVDGIEAELSDGTSVEARLLVAADGGQSKLRKKAGILWLDI